MAPSNLAGEALWVPLGVEGGDVALHDGLLTPLAARGKLLVVALPAEGLVVLLVEALGAKVLATERAEEVLRVPGLVQGAHHSLGQEGEGEVNTIHPTAPVGAQRRPGHMLTGFPMEVLMLHVGVIL